MPNKQTAPGIDLLDWTIIKAAIAAIPKLFLNTYQQLFNGGHHPIQWKTAIGIIIPKKNKKDYAEPKAYRPIALLPCLSKLLKRLFANRLAYFANTTNQLLHPSQMGGRKQRSAVDAALLLQEFVERNMASQKIVSTILLDIFGEFDRLRPESLINILESLSLPRSFISWTKSFLRERKIRLLFNGQISKVHTVSGTPQGSPISPILFLISIRNLISSHGNLNVFQVSYMDDIAVAVASTSITKNIRLLTEATKRLFLIAQNISATFELDKTELIHFHRKRQVINSPLDIQGITLEPKEIVKWLGFWLDQRLSYKTHVDKRLQLASGVIQNIKRLTSPSRGLRLNQIRQLYLSCVTTVLDYGSILWYQKYGTEKHSNKYQRIQNIAARMITGAYYGSPAKALEVEAAILPCRVRHLKLAYSYALRILRLQTIHPIQECLFTSQRNESSSILTSKFNLLAHLIDNKTQIVRLGKLLSPLTSNWRLEHSEFNWNPPWKSLNIAISIPKLEKQVLRTRHETLFSQIHPSASIIYTDGSRTIGKGSSIGFVIYLPYTREAKFYSFNLGDGVGITDAETYCILKSIKTLKNISSSRKCYIFSDSQAALLRIKNANNYFCHQIRRHAHNYQMSMEWCPGHIGIEGNEIADGLARKGAELEIHPQNKYITISVLKENANQEILKAWRKIWNVELL